MAAVPVTAEPLRGDAIDMTVPETLVPARAEMDKAPADPAIVTNRQANLPTMDSLFPGATGAAAHPETIDSVIIGDLFNARSKPV
jgi:hypothetical protein